MKTNTLILLAFYVGIFAILTYLYGFFGFLLGMIVVAMISVIALLPMKKDIYVVLVFFCSIFIILMVFLFGIAFGLLLGLIVSMVIIGIATVPKIIILIVKEIQEKQKIKDTEIVFLQYKTYIEKEIVNANKTKADLVKVIVRDSEQNNLLMEKLKKYFEVKRYNYSVLQRSEGAIVKILVN